jgi:hypothetical protein
VNLVGWYGPMSAEPGCMYRQDRPGACAWCTGTLAFYMDGLPAHQHLALFPTHPAGGVTGRAPQ